MSDQSTRPENESARIAKEANASTHYAMYSVFKANRELSGDRGEMVAEAQSFFDSFEAKDTHIRGIYDVAGLRADADLMVWSHATTVEQLQEVYSGFLLTKLGRHFDGVWSNVGIHRQAEFNRGHIPNFLSGNPSPKYLCVYPFVRSYDWYVLPEEDRRRMLKEHGLAARDYKDVGANTIAAFALGDYEWLLAFEAEELHRIVDLMRELRAVDARLHVREEIPFYTGPKITIEDLVARLR
ncbi:hydrogen peroxide-dependent heme synthase [Leekyejoonella antrihumi]|uniref:Coproheme decarboxylase n=1 Tax=Leekyejoonella antrihumi TaxID=1660198 RepID=A0A563DUF3_9MICO|nr:hydrogen peroxide-dependent heme synthase [Leekyejoonella antrihumi]TWP33581.1 chlorite dismutase family protein [Leekyejoonella antrihumi]